MSEITFKEDTHQYFNERGEEYISATTFIHLFQQPFDQIGAATRVAKREGVTVEEILKRWKDKSRKSCEYGTNVHAKMEEYIKTGKIDSNYLAMYQSFDDIVGKDKKYAKQVFSELKLHNDEYLIAGTADLLIDLNDNEFIVGDFKTNEQFQYYNKYGQHMLSPVQHLSDCHHNVYALQLSLYAYFYGLKTGKTCRNVFLMYSNDLSGWQFVPANYMEIEVRAMLRYYKNHKEEMLHK